MQIEEYNFGRNAKNCRIECRHPSGGSWAPENTRPKKLAYCAQAYNYKVISSMTSQASVDQVIL